MLLHHSLPSNSPPGARNDRTASVDLAPRLLEPAGRLLVDALPPLPAEASVLELGDGTDGVGPGVLARLAGLGRLVTVRAAPLTLGGGTGDSDSNAATRLQPAGERHSWLVGDPARLPFASGSFDAIVCNHTPSHPRRDGRTLEELARCLRPGGWLVWAVLLEGSLAALFDALIDAADAQGPDAAALSLRTQRALLPSPALLQEAMAPLGFDLVHLGVQERAIAVTQASRDPLVLQALLPALLELPNAQIPPTLRLAAVGDIRDRGCVVVRTGIASLRRRGS